MHKLAKGLKKKKKKKDKKGAEEDDFDPEELERYRRERAEAQQQAEASSDTGAVVSGSDEWKKFEALTAGVDSILKKTQGDLDRIKSTSFFQRKPVESESKFNVSQADANHPSGAPVKQSQSKKWLNFDKDGNPIEGDAEDSEDVNKDKTLQITKEGFVDIPDDDEDHEDSIDEDIFDTTYVDVLQNIELQLAYIPDSPTQEEADDDPFDTTNADKVLKTVDKKGRKVLSLGNAVEVLSGRIDHVSTCKIGRPKKNKSVDLLLDESEEGTADVVDIAQNTSESAEVAAKTLLDDDTDLPDVPVDLTKLPPILPKSTSPVTATPNETVTDTEENSTAKSTVPFDVSEFEILKEKNILEEIPDLGDDEFDLDTELSNEVVLQEVDDPFAEKEPENAAFSDEIVEVHFEAKTNAEGEDPFDTTFAENILPGKTELKFIEKELEELPVSQVSISLTDPAGLNRDYETGLLKLTSDDQKDISSTSNLAPKKEDLLGGSVTDLSQLADEPIAPVEEITYVDPFDTSSVQQLPPGKVELKFLEKELLGEEQSKLSSSLDDDDFDPRKDEVPVTVPSVTSVQITDNVDDKIVDSKINGEGRKTSRPEILNVTVTKCVDFTLPTPTNRTDLLATSDEERNIPSKPLTPYYSQNPLEQTLPDVTDENELENQEREEDEIDPFDTNFVAKIAPGKTELRLIESELLAADSQLQSENNLDNNLNSIPQQSDSVITARDESTIESNENFALKRQESILDAQVNVTAKPLTPNIESKTIEEDSVDEFSYADPFDTSIATNILPGKTELKILEKELSQIEEVPKIADSRISLIPLTNINVPEDDDFNPRADEKKESQDYLCLDGQDSGDKVLTPLHEDPLALEEDIDPFDTSFASLAPGKTELKLLESQLVSK